MSGRGRAARRRDQAGAVSAELVVITPVLLLLVMCVVQFALWQHAVHVAEAAAQRGEQAARLRDGTDADGSRAATAAAQALGSSLIVAPSVQVSRTNNVVTVDVSGTAESVVPFLTLPVHATAQGPVERFVPPAP